MAISKDLLERYGISISPGRKGTCPFCKKQTFSITKDDALGRCFHPFCGRRLFDQEASWSKLDAVRWDLMTKLRANLQETRAESPEAWLYLTETRRIHPAVIERATIGRVATSIDVHGLYRSVIPNKADSVEEKECKKIQDLLVKVPGWLAFFYADDGGRITFINLRKPNSKDFACITLGHEKGVFGHSLWQGDLDYSADYGHTDKLTIVEGEFNALRLQSVATNCGHDYVPVVAIGSANSPDLVTLDALCRGQIHFIHDRDDAGEAVLSVVANGMHLTYSHTAEPHKDLDDLMSALQDPAGQWQAYLALTEPMGKKGPSHAVLRNLVDAARLRRKAHIALREASEVVLRDLKWRGELLWARDQPYHFDAETSVLLDVDAGGFRLHSILDGYGLNATEPAYKYVVQQIRTTANKEGRKTEMYKYAHYSKALNKVYLHVGSGKVCVISPEGVSTEKNGIDDILLIGSEADDGFQLLPQRPSQGSLEATLFGGINFSQRSAVTPAMALELLKAWVLALFFGSIMPTRPITLFLGEKGSGKSSALRMIGMLLHGRHFNVTPLPAKEEDFDVIVAASHLLALDNVDACNAWLKDRLAVAATGGTATRRRLYYDTELIELRLDSFIGMTSRTPEFRRDDIAQRMLVFQLDELERFRPESELCSAVLDNRDALMTELCWWISDVLKVLNNPASHDVGAFRMNDFASFAVRASSNPDLIIAGLKAMQSLQSIMTLEKDPLVDLLELWVEKRGRVRSYTATSKELFADLRELSRAYLIDFKYTSHRSFAQKMGRVYKELKTYIDIEVLPGSSRKRVWRINAKLDEE